VREEARRDAALDRFRLLAAVLVVCIHTSPLTSYTPAGDFWLTRVLGRVAVPFFFMVSGYFLARNDWKTTGRFLRKTLLVYGLAVAFYLPLNWYTGGFTAAEWLRRLATDGTVYHLWYFPALILGVLIARALARLGLPAALTVAGILYLFGLGGDSYYGLAAGFPVLEGFYGSLFRVFSYSRNGLFFAPLFLLLGAAAKGRLPARSLPGAALGLALMTAEGFWLRGLGWQRHDSMYLALPLCMVFLFSFLLGKNRGEDRAARRLSALVYLLHPLMIVLVRGVARAAGLERLLIENSLGHFLAVLAAAFFAAVAFDRLRARFTPAV